MIPRISLWVLVSLLLLSGSTAWAAESQDDAAVTAELAKLRTEVEQLRAEVARLKKQLADDHEQARLDLLKARTKRNLKDIGVACNMYLNEFGGTEFFPKSLAELAERKLVTDDSIFIHPYQGSAPVKGKFVCDYDNAFDRAGYRLSDSQLTTTFPMVWEAKPRFQGGRVVTFPDSHVELVDEKRFQEMLKALDALIEKHRKKGGEQ